MEGLQDQAQLMLLQHCRTQQPSEPVRFGRLLLMHLLLLSLLMLLNSLPMLLNSLPMLLNSQFQSR